MIMAASISSAASVKAEVESLEELLKHLELNEDKLSDVVVGKEEVKKFDKEARWLAIVWPNIDHHFHMKFYVTCGCIV